MLQLFEGTVLGRSLTWSRKNVALFDEVVMVRIRGSCFNCSREDCALFEEAVVTPREACDLFGEVVSIGRLRTVPCSRKWFQLFEGGL